MLSFGSTCRVPYQNSCNQKKIILKGRLHIHIIDYITASCIYMAMWKFFSKFPQLLYKKYTRYWGVFFKIMCYIYAY